jgi:hypothetical protein
VCKVSRELFHRYFINLFFRVTRVGAACGVSASNGLENVVIDHQSALLDAAVSPWVPRFIRSGVSLDGMQTRPGEKQNMDLWHMFRARLDRAPGRTTSVLNGVFSTVLTEDARIHFQFRRRANEVCGHERRPHFLRPLAALRRRKWAPSPLC